MLWPAKPEKKEPPTTAIGVNLYRYLNSPTKQIQRRHSNIIIVDQISFKSSIKAYPCKVWYMHGMVPHKVLSSVSCYWLLCKPQLQSWLPISWTSTGSTNVYIGYSPNPHTENWGGGGVAGLEERPRMTKFNPGLSKTKPGTSWYKYMRMEQTKLSLFTCGAV